MPTYKTPGVYIEEVSVFPPSVAAVETAIPAFIGYTQKASDAQGNDLTNVPMRITSLLEFETFFGGAQATTFEVNLDATATPLSTTFDALPQVPTFYLYYSVQHFYANGGGPCHVISVGEYAATFPGDAKTKFKNAITKLLEGLDEPTLVVVPESSTLAEDDHAEVVNTALAHCKKMQDRFAIVDVRNAVPGETDTNAKVDASFRGKISSDLAEVKYGAAYFPYLRTSIGFEHDDDDVTIKAHTGAPAAESLAGKKLSEIDTTHTAVYDAVKQFVGTARVVLPPSGAIAGVYARVDNDRGVWKAPANVSIKGVIKPMITITNDLNDGLNIDATSGKSVNAIRSFTGKGTLVWGARTLAGNDNENRYVPVRRFLNFAEESIKKATAFFVFEPNDANTWTKVRSMIESFLIRQWRDGALAGAKPDDAFFVSVGLNKTMSAQDILDGYMIVEIGLAIVRPAEFIVLKFAQQMQQS